MAQITRAVEATEALAAGAVDSGAVDTGLPRKKPSLTHYLMVVPALLGFFVFIVVPTIQGMFYSFTDYAGYGDWHFIGWANFAAMFQDPNIGQAYKFTILYAAVTTVLLNAASLYLAVLLNGKARWPNLWKGVYFIPMVLSGLVVAYCFQTLLNISLPKIVSWGIVGDGILTNPGWAWLGVVFVTIWATFPGTVIIYLAGLSSIGSDVYEAGELDGAKPFAQFRHLTLPLLAPFVVINTVLGLKGLLNAYDIIWGLTGGGPGNATTSIAMSITGTVTNSDVAYGTAQAMVFFVVTIALSLLQLGAVKLIGRKS